MGKKFSLKKYERLEELYESLWGMPFKDLLEGSVGDECLDGTVCEVDFKSVLEGDAERGYSGYTDGETIHYWVDFEDCI